MKREELKKRFDDALKDIKKTPYQNRDTVCPHCTCKLEYTETRESKEIRLFLYRLDRDLYNHAPALHEIYKDELYDYLEGKRYKYYLSVHEKEEKNDK
jgi:hypothetical protein